MYYELGTMVAVMKGASPFSNHEKGISIPGIDVIGEIVSIHPTTLSYTVRLSKKYVLVFGEDDIYGLPGWMSDKRYLFHKMLGSIIQADARSFYYVKEFENFVNNYEDQKKGKELLKFSKECIKYDRERPEFLPEYRNIPIGLEQSLNKVHDDMINSLLYSVPTFYMKKEEVNAMFGVPKFEYKKIIFNGPCTIILWKDGTKTIAKASNGEWFDPEKGVAICFMKRALGETEGKKVLRKANKDFYDEITRAANKELEKLVKPVSEYCGEKVVIEAWDFGEDAARRVMKPMDNNAIVNIDQSTIDEVKKVEEEKKMDFRSCLDCKYASKPVTDKPCSDCASKSRFERGYEK